MLIFLAKLTFSTLFTIWHICAKAAILVGHPIMQKESTFDYNFLQLIIVDKTKPSMYIKINGFQIGVSKKSNQLFKIYHCLQQSSWLFPSS